METDNNSQLPNSMETAGAAIADRCARDPDWLAKFTANPRQTLEEACGRKLPSDLQIHLHQNDDDNWHVPVAGAGGRLRDSDLQKVAGGEIAIAMAVVGGLAATVAAGAVVGGGIGAGVVVSDRKKQAKKK